MLSQEYLKDILELLNESIDDIKKGQTNEVEDNLNNIKDVIEEELEYSKERKL